MPLQVRRPGAAPAPDSAPLRPDRCVAGRGHRTPFRAGSPMVGSERPGPRASTNAPSLGRLSASSASPGNVPIGFLGAYVKGPAPRLPATRWPIDAPHARPRRRGRRGVDSRRPRGARRPHLPERRPHRHGRGAVRELPPLRRTAGSPRPSGCQTPGVAFQTPPRDTSSCSSAATILVAASMGRIAAGRMLASCSWTLMVLPLRRSTKADLLSRCTDRPYGPAPCCTERVNTGLSG